jgi:hypothetical protein
VGGELIFDLNIVESVKDDIIAGLMTGDVKTSWYQRPKVLIIIVLLTQLFFISFP